jgi:putative oxidoreductase
MGFLKNRKLLFISRLVLGAIFIYASYDKVLNPLAFAQVIHNYRLMPPQFINIIAIILPWIELLAGAFLIIGIWVRGANFIIGVLLIMYIAMLSITAIRGININCGCFSISSAVKSNLVARIIEDIGMFILSLHIFAFYKEKSRRYF